jgi:hypothetical protein
MNLTRLPHHEHPAPPYHELLQKGVFYSGNRNIGQVENLYVDDDRNLQFFDAVTSGVLRLRKKHHLVPADAIADESPGDITLRENQATVEGAPPPSDAHAGRDDELQRPPPASRPSPCRGANFAEHLPTRTLANKGKKTSISAPRPTETEREGQRGCT